MFPSPSLTTKILSVNLLALMILIIGVLYVGRYQSNLIDSELERLQTESILFAGALQESVLTSVGPDTGRTSVPKPDTDFIVDRARRLVDTLADNSGNRIRLYNKNGSLLADSGLRGKPGDYIEIEPLKPIGETGQATPELTERMLNVLDNLPLSVDLPSAPDFESNSLSLPMAQSAMEGEPQARAWSIKRHKILLTAAAPVFAANGTGGVRGMVLISREGQRITDAIAQVRFEVLRISAIAFVFTLLLSLYLAWVIGMPLRRLGNAARRIREGHQVAEIPVYTHRSDEIGTLSIALRDMTRALGDRLDTIEQFAGDISHELKNPLSSMRSATETLERKISKGQIDDNTRKLMDVLMHDVERMNRLITDIATTSRLDVALEREGRSVVDMAGLLQDIIDLQSQFAGDIPIRVRSHTQDDFTIRGNKDRLAQVFQNLIDNAVSFSSKGDQVDIRLHKDRDWVVVAVEDKGPGIPAEKIDAIFDRFYSERPGHEEYGEHSGLGLAIARQIVEAHRGDIRAENIKGGKHDVSHISGARFIVRLPAA